MTPLRISLFEDVTNSHTADLFQPENFLELERQRVVFRIENFALVGEPLELRQDLAGPLTFGFYNRDLHSPFSESVAKSSQNRENR